MRRILDTSVNHAMCISAHVVLLGFYFLTTTRVIVEWVPIGDNMELNGVSMVLRQHGYLFNSATLRVINYIILNHYYIVALSD